MIAIGEAMKILNKKGKKYTIEQGKSILELFFQLAEITYNQFKYIKNNETSNFVFASIN